MKFATLSVFSLLAAGVQAGDISFSREIRPILSNKCYYCHGPDGSKREAGLRLDTYEGATAVIEESKARAIVPGDPAASEMIRRIRLTDPEEIMPPPESHLTLGKEEAELLEKWIMQGAKYEKHWAFTPLPASVAVPEIPAGMSARNEIDHFVIARLAQEKLAPSREADPLRLLRRVSFDLTGLPPTPEEISSFETSKFETAVDRLLASPHFGETMALEWLDAARYADSYGYQSDLLSGQWPWRDWVIRAFNENLPYDQFATWQLAGDLLPDATRDQILATAFNRLNRMTQEGGSIHEEYRVEGVSDRVHTFGTTFLALTLECSRCHDHKYDPISARDYYSIGSFFNSIPERGVYSDQKITPGPALMLPAPDQKTQIRAAEKAVAAAQAALPQTIGPADRVALFDFEPSKKPDVSPNRVDGPAKEAKIGGLKTTTAPGGRAVVLDGDQGISIPGLLTEDWPQPWTVDLVLRDTVANPEPVVLWQRTFGTDAGYNGYDCTLASGRIEVRIARDWPGAAVGVITAPIVGKDQWHRVSITWDGSGRAAGLAVYVDGKPVPTEITTDRLRQSVIDRTYGNGNFTLGERFRDRGFRGGEIDSLSVFNGALAPLEIAKLQQPGKTELAVVPPQVREARQKLQAARQALVDIESKVRTVAVMDETPVPRPTWILPRGVYSTPHTPENEVTRNTFSQILPPFPAAAPRDRLGLAKWLTQPDHPLTSRVFVNRIWQHFFGTGLVPTSDNFGFQGTAPSHPELLDWLARDFVSHGWDVKRLCRQIVLSATYRQDSRLRPGLREKDPANILLARGPARRLAAEPVRDLALAASGQLVSKTGGPPVSPYQPGPDLWRESNSMSPSYQQSKGDDLRRRSIYSVWKRTAPLPNALLFDAAGRETCSVKRTSTNTPLQALVLLNDPQFIEPSRALAEVVLRDHPDDTNARITAAFLRLAGRQPDSRELDLLSQLLTQQLDVFKAKPDSAKAFLKIGEKTTDAAINPAILAANTVLCQTILNLDAVIWNR